MRKFASALFFAATLASCLAVNTAVAADVAAASTATADPTGAWKWTATAMSRTVDVTATLTLKDGQLTGTIGNKAHKTEIKDATFSADEGTITFTVERERNGKKVTTSYEGKLAGNTITGTIKIVGPKGKSTDSEWKATRAP